MRGVLLTIIRTQSKGWGSDGEFPHLRMHKRWEFLAGDLFHLFMVFYRLNKFVIFFFYINIL